MIQTCACQKHMLGPSDDVTCWAQIILWKSYCNNICKTCTESAVSSDTYIGGKNVEEIAQEIEMGGECGWHLANVCNCGTWKNPQYEWAQLWTMNPQNIGIRGDGGLCRAIIGSSQELRVERHSEYAPTSRYPLQHAFSEEVVRDTSLFSIHY